MKPWYMYVYRCQKNLCNIFFKILSSKLWNMNYKIRRKERQCRIQMGSGWHWHIITEWHNSSNVFSLLFSHPQFFHRNLPPALSSQSRLDFCLMSPPQIWSCTQCCYYSESLPSPLYSFHWRTPWRGVRTSRELLWTRLCRTPQSSSFPGSPAQ